MLRKPETFAWPPLTFTSIYSRKMSTGHRDAVVLGELRLMAFEQKCFCFSRSLIFSAACEHLQAQLKPIQYIMIHTKLWSVNWAFKNEFTLALTAKEQKKSQLLSDKSSFISRLIIGKWLLKRLIKTTSSVMLLSRKYFEVPSAIIPHVLGLF